MKEPAMRKWYIGLAALGLFTVGLTIYLVLQGAGSRQDNLTYQQANSIADKINNYVDQNSAVPDSLGQVGASDVPTTITYSKLSDSSYRLCEKYHSGNNDVAGQVSSQITNTTFGRFSSSGSSGYTPSSSQNYYLYIDPNYHAGTNCQTVTIDNYFVDNSTTNNLDTVTQ